MSIVKSSYNFVPLNEQVCFPKWSQYVSQDIPLKDALSGSINLEIIAKTPIFVRGKCIKEHEDGHKEFEFMRHNGNFCIPGSSIKGTIASVLEIMTFGKLQRVNNTRFSQRDWFNTKDYKKQSFAKDNRGGWLKYDNETESYKIDYNTESIGRIEHEEIDSFFETDFINIFGENFDEAKAGENKSARKKYNLLKGKSLKLENAFIEKPKKKPEEQQCYSINQKGVGAKTGIIVFSGQPSKRKKKRDGKWTGKNKEFIFWEPDVKNIQVTEDVINDFLFAYYDHDPKEIGVDWEYWKKTLENGKEIPVFLQLDTNGKVKHLGLSMLYKLPYENRINDLIPKLHQNKKSDFIDTLFGFSQEQDSAKGRISFQHAFATENLKEIQPVTLVLSEPKASYYPFYLAQEFKNTDNTKIKEYYNTYNNNDKNEKSKLAGRKRYPVKYIDESLGAPKEKFSTTFTPFNSEIKFYCKVLYHNVLPVELGALLCALTFNDVKEDCYHGIGMGKPYGYGAVKINATIKDDKVALNSKLAFRAYMETWWQQQRLSGTWSESEQMKQLIAMAQFPSEDNELYYKEKLSYMSLDDKDFQNIKKEKKALPRFTNFLGVSAHNYSDFYRNQIKEFKQKEKNRILAEKQIALQKKQEENERKRLADEKEALANGLATWLLEIKNYGELKEKMDKWISMGDNSPVDIPEDIEIVEKAMYIARSKKALRYHKDFFIKKKNDLINWIGKEATDRFLRNDDK